MTNPFPQWLPEVSAAAVVIDPDAINAEANGNLWGFGLTREQADGVSVADVVGFAAAVADARRAWLSAHSAAPMVLYWWHDAQAGQLRFSLVSAAHGHLPFGCRVIAAASLRAVMEAWLQSPYLHGIPWDAVSPPAPEAEVAQAPPFELPVWSLELP
jgi:hypothetical protein